MDNLEIVYLPIDELNPYDKNARKHADRDIDAIMNSISDFGFNDPVGIWGEKNLIVEGHGRVIAAKKLGMTRIPCIRLDQLTDQQRRGYALAHNRTAELSGWDFDIAAEEIQALRAEDFGEDLIDLFGNTIPNLDAEDVSEDEDFDEDSVTESRAQLGDIWVLGNHRLICGDSSKPETFQNLLGGVKADMVFTDPPYGVAVGDKNKALDEVQKAERITENIANDDIGTEELYELLKNCFINIKANCTEDACYYVTSPQGGSLGLMMMMMRDAGLEVRHVLMWKKNTATFSIGRLDYDYQHEPIFYTWGKKHHNFRKGENRTTVWSYDKPRKCDLHPTMKPVPLVANAILDGSKKGMIVLDAFGGSGTTMIAAEQTGRSCYMIELDPHYCDVIINRWEQFTGKKAELLSRTGG